MRAAEGRTSAIIGGLSGSGLSHVRARRIRVRVADFECRKEGKQQDGVDMEIGKQEKNKGRNDRRQETVRCNEENLKGGRNGGGGGGLEREVGEDTGRREREWDAETLGLRGDIDT